MKLLLILLMVEIGVMGLLVLLQLESIKNEIVDVLKWKEKEMLNAVAGKFTQAMHKDPSMEGRVPDLSAMAQAKLKAHTLSAQDPEQR